SYGRALGKASSGASLPSALTTITLTGGVGARVSFPSTWSYRTPIPLVMQFKGYGSVGDDFLRPEMISAANQLGYAVAVAQYGDTYGNKYGLDLARELYLKILMLAPISGVVLWGNSMGGASALNALLTG